MFVMYDGRCMAYMVNDTKHVCVDTERKIIRASMIFKWYKKDFVGAAVKQVIILHATKKKKSHMYYIFRPRHMPSCVEIVLYMLQDIFFILRTNVVRKLVGILAKLCATKQQTVVGSLYETVTISCNFFSFENHVQRIDSVNLEKLLNKFHDKLIKKNTKMIDFLHHMLIRYPIEYMDYDWNINIINST